MRTSHTNDFECLVMEHKSTIYSVCYIFTDTRTDADDLFQEVLINLWKGFETFAETRISVHGFIGCA